MFFLQNSLIFAVDKIPHLQGTTPCLGISKIWSIQLLLFDFVIIRWWRHNNVKFCYEI